MTQLEGSPLKRLVALVTSLKGHQSDAAIPDVTWTEPPYTRQAKAFGGLLCRALDKPVEEGKQYTAHQMLEAFADFMNLAQDALKYVEANSVEESINENLKPVVKIVAAAQRIAILDRGNALMSDGRFTENDLNQLRALAANLRAYNNEKVMTEEEIDTLVSAIDHLIETVRSSSLDDRVRDRMLDLLGNLRTLSLRINIAGPDKVLEGLNTYLGQTIIAAASAHTPDQHRSARELFEDGVRTVVNIHKLVDVANKLTPPILKAGEMLPQLLG